MRLIVPFAPGGGTDFIARVLAKRLYDVWGNPVIVDNRPGAGSTIGTDLAAKARPDGYTLVLSSISLAFNASLYKKLPFDPVQDLTPISMVAIQPNVLVANPRLPSQSVKELIAFAKQKPGVIKYASGGNGSGPHLATELLKMLAKIDLTHVPYKGTGPALTDLIAGRVDVMIAVTASALPHVHAGRLRALAVTGDKRSPLLPNVPTISESVPGYEFKTWYGVQAPVRTPPAIVTEINRKVSEILDRADVVEQFSAAGIEARSSSPRDFGLLVAAEITKWATVVKASAARVD